MATQKRLITADELIRMPEDGCKYELLGGVLLTMSPPGAWHGAVGGNAYALLWTHVRQHAGGRVFQDIGVFLGHNPDTVRAPDVCYLSAERLPPGGIPRGYLDVVPDLIVEVISPSDRRSEVEEKVLDWLRGGARIVWVIDPDRRTVAIHTPVQAPHILGETETLTADPVLPGFSVPVRDLFA
jgi:Uma2 family endonuclease